MPAIADTSHVRYFELGDTRILGADVGLQQAEGQGEGLCVALVQGGPGHLNILPAGDPYLCTTPKRENFIPPGVAAALAALLPTLATLDGQVVFGDLAPGCQLRATHPTDGKVAARTESIVNEVFRERVASGWRPGEQGRLCAGPGLRVDTCDVSGARKEKGKPYDPQADESDAHVRRVLLDVRDATTPLFLVIIAPYWFDFLFRHSTSTYSTKSQLVTALYMSPVQFSLDDSHGRQHVLVAGGPTLITMFSALTFLTSPHTPSAINTIVASALVYAAAVISEIETTRTRSSSSLSSATANALRLGLTPLISVDKELRLHRSYISVRNLVKVRPSPVG